MKSILRRRALFSSVRSRAIAACVLMLSLLMATTLLGVTRTQEQQSKLSELQATSVASVALETARVEFFSGTNALVAFSFDNDPKHFVEYTASIERARQSLTSATGIAQQQGRQADISSLDQIASNIEEFDSTVSLAAAQFLAGDRAAATQNQTHLTELNTGIENDLAVASQTEQAAVASDRAAAASSLTTTMLMLVGLGAFAAVVAVASALTLVVSIVRPLNRLRASSRDITEGRLDVRAPVGGPDELARLADDFNKMTETLLSSNHQLTLNVSRREAIEEQLRTVNQSLEEKVDERTTRLREANKEMEGEVLERKRAEQEAKQTSSILQSTLEATADGILVVNQSGEIVTFNQRFVDMWGIPSDVMSRGDRGTAMQHAIGQLKHPKLFVSRTRQLYSDPEAEGFDMLTLKDGRVFERSSMPRREAGVPAGRAWSFRDVTDRSKAEEQVRYLAFHDALTGLPNRTRVQERLMVLLSESERRITAILFLDIDRFKFINDSLGHSIGDGVLQAVAGRLRQLVPRPDLVGRVGGDEFMILMPHLDNELEATELAEQIVCAFRDPIIVAEHEFRLTTSIGITLCPADGSEAEVLIRNADAAMYRAKDQGGDSYFRYAPEMEESVQRHRELERDLHMALDRDEFVMYYQPQADVASGDIVGMEALIRWKHPERGLVLPDDFIPFAEESGLILKITDVVLKKVCQQAAAWKDMNLNFPRVFINLSAREFGQANLVQIISTALAEANLDPMCIGVEITEAAIMKSFTQGKTSLSSLRELGILIAIDDFGTGYSSLSYLKQLPIDAVKIDKSFISDMSTDRESVAIVRAIIAMSKACELLVVAEGVESEQQLSSLRQLQCDQFQGYLLSRPIDGSTMTELLTTRSRSTLALSTLSRA